jgi:peptide/nickel transport system permease protein
VGLIAVGLGTTLGSAIGLISGYAGGRVDLLLQRLMDVLMAFPTLILAIATVAMLGPTTTNVVVAMAIVFMPTANRVVRGSVLAEKENQYVEAARAIGCGGARIAFRHLLPNVAAPIIVIASTSLGTAILVESSLSFLGLGPPPPTPTWGAMLSIGSRTFFEQAPWMAIFPGLAISLAIFGFNLLGDALRDLLDPRLRSDRR